MIPNFCIQRPVATTLLAIGVILAGPLVSIGGAVFLTVRHEAIVTLRRVAGDYAWLSGAKPAYLEQLPSWESFALEKGFAPNLPTATE